MTVYVLNVDYKYPDVDGHGYTLGVYSSKKKAKEALEKSKPQVEYYLGSGAEGAYRLIINKFEIDLA